MASFFKSKCRFAWTICSITKHSAKMSWLDVAIEWLSRLLCILEVLGSYNYPERQFPDWGLSLFLSVALSSCGLHFLKLDSRSLLSTFLYFVILSPFIRQYSIFFCLEQKPNLTQGDLFVRFLDHTQLDTHARGRTPPDEWSACCRGRYLTTHKKKQNRRTSLLSAEFQTTIPEIKRLQNYALGRMVTGISDGILQSNLLTAS